MSNFLDESESGETSIDPSEMLVECARQAEHMKDMIRLVLAKKDWYAAKLQIFDTDESLKKAVDFMLVSSGMISQACDNILKEAGDGWSGVPLDDSDRSALFSTKDFIEKFERLSRMND